MGKGLKTRAVERSVQLKYVKFRKIVINANFCIILVPEISRPNLKRYYTEQTLFVIYPEGGKCDDRFLNRKMGS
jgi:hypothetical protein